MFKRMLHLLVALLWAAAWTGFGLVAAYSKHGNPWVCGAIGAMIGLVLWRVGPGSRHMAKSAPAARKNAPADWRKDVLECELPVDDVLERWRDRSPEPRKRAAPRLIANPPPCVRGKVEKTKRLGATLIPGTKFFRWERIDDAAFAACRKLEEINRRISPLPFRWTRINDRVCEVLGPGSNPFRVRVKLAEGVVEEVDQMALQPAYPKKGEWWLQTPCDLCAFHEDTELFFAFDGGSTSIERVRCGCLRPSWRP